MQDSYFCRSMILYTLSIRLYFFLARIYSLFNTKAKAFIQGRRHAFRDLKSFSDNNESPVLWFHAASLGEFEQGLTVMEAFKKTNPEYRIAVTFFSPSGYELRKGHAVIDFCCYLPMDSKSSASKFLDILKPEKVFFIKYEFWFHYLNQAKKRNIPTYCISARFTENHIFFKWYGDFQRRILGLFDHIFVQNEQSLKLLESINLNQASISGDTRFDRVRKTLSNPESYPEIAQFKGDSLLCIIGSAWASDMQVLKGFINKSPDHLKLILAPHMVDEAHVNQVTEGLKVEIGRYTKGDFQTAKVLVLDTIGMLSNVYQYGDFAYIGGAMGPGLHNILEAVTFGLPVVYGNKGLDKFPESSELQERGGSFSIANEAEATNILNKLLKDENFRTNTSEICRRYIEEKSGATERIMNFFNQAE